MTQPMTAAALDSPKMTLPDPVIAEARSWIGTPYRHQASLKGVGCDCLGLVRGVWRAVCGPEPEAAGSYSSSWAEADREERLAQAADRYMCAIDLAARKPGDVVLFRWRGHLPAKHAAILSGEEMMIHAHDGERVCEVHLSRWWQRHMAYAFRFPDMENK